MTFVSGSGLDNPPYEPVRDMNQLKDLLTEKLEDYALEPGNSAMDLVLFRDALHHVCRIHRWGLREIADVPPLLPLLT